MFWFRLGNRKEVFKCQLFGWINVLATEAIAGQVEYVVDYFRTDVLADILIKLNNVFSGNPFPSFWLIGRFIEFFYEPPLFKVLKEGILDGGNKVYGLVLFIYG